MEKTATFLFELFTDFAIVVDFYFARNGAFLPILARSPARIGILSSQPANALKTACFN
jgi:hypothetical protein